MCLRKYYKCTMSSTSRRNGFEKYKLVSVAAADGAATAAAYIPHTAATPESMIKDAIRNTFMNPHMSDEDKLQVLTKTLLLQNSLPKSDTTTVPPSVPVPSQSRTMSDASTNAGGLNLTGAFNSIVRRNNQLDTQSPVSLWGANDTDSGYSMTGSSIDNTQTPHVLRRRNPPLPPPMESPSSSVKQKGNGRRHAKDCVCPLCLWNKRKQKRNMHRCSAKYNVF
jgi:hypothetical protein